MAEEKFSILIIRMIGIRFDPSEWIIERRLRFLEGCPMPGFVGSGLPIIPLKNARHADLQLVKTASSSLPHRIATLFSPRVTDHLGAVVEAQLVEDVAHVKLHCVLADIETLGELAIRDHHHIEHFALSRTTTTGVTRTW
jgi:hypothetical protein